jgi:phenylacetic acid degradation operon negative regulatory protein
MGGFLDDSRLMLLAMAAEGVEATGAALAELWRRSSRAGRLDRTLRALEKKGLIAGGGEAALDGRLFRLTAEGQARLAGPIDPEARWARKWDGQWRLVLFDVPQSRAAVRTRLRRKLRELRFGWLQNSVWINPDPVDELKRDFEQHRNSVESLVLLEARPAGGETDEELVAGAWDFAQLAKDHAAYHQVLRLRPGTRSRAGDIDAWLAWAESERRAWKKIVERDPFLPEVLWPKGYAGRTAWHARREALAVCSETLMRAATAD